MQLKYYHIVFFLFSSVGFSQNNVLNLSVSNTNPEVGESFEISVKSSLSQDIQIITPTGFVSGAVMNGISQQIINSKRKTIYYKTESGLFQNEGTFVIGPAKIRSGNKVYTSNTIVVNVSNQGKNSLSPQGKTSAQKLSERVAFGLIETNKTSVYIGEPIRLNARVYAKFEPNSFENYKEYISKCFPDKKKIPNPDIANVEMKSFENKRFYSFSYDKSICFPTATGTFTIQPFQMNLGNFFDQEKIISESGEITVKPLPGEKPPSFNGTVGKVKMERIIKKGAKKQGDVAVVSYIFSGSGNIHSIEIPDLKLPPSIQLYGDPEIKEDFEFNENGAEGKLTIDYNIQMLDPGKLLIPTFEFSYFDLETERFIISFADSIYFEVSETPGFDRKKAQEEANKRLTSKKNKKDSQDSIFSSIPFLVSIGVGLITLLGLLFLFFRKRNSKNQVQVKNQGNEKEDNLEIQEVQNSNSNGDVKFDLTNLETQIDSPSDYIKCLSEKMDTWLNEVSKSKVSTKLSRVEKLTIMEKESALSEDIKAIKYIFNKIDEARYGLQVDSSFCREIHEKVVEIFNK